MNEQVQQKIYLFLGRYRYNSYGSFSIYTSYFWGINDQFQDILFVLWKKIWFLNILLFSYSHSDEPLFPCDLCGKKFWGKRQRTHHILATHENKRDHICTYCGKGFHTKAKMIRHSEVVSIVTTECYMLDWFK